jgi:sugar lactone lactonase YvrE
MKTAFRMALLSTALALVATTVGAQQITNSSPPFTRVDNYLKLPDGRHMGSTNTIHGDSKGNIWIVERCGANNCEGSNLDPVMQFTKDGKFIKSFGKGKLLFPHGFTIDNNDHLWIADNHNNGKIGDDVIEFDQNGKVLMTLGTPGKPGNDYNHFHEPNAVAVAPNGDIYVADGHSADVAQPAGFANKNQTPTTGNARVSKFDKHGKFLTAWGGHGSGDGQFQNPHCLGITSKGDVFVGDRSNNRIEKFTANGKFISAWSQFGRPSGCFVDSKDNLYVSDSESHEHQGYGHNPGFKRGVRIGSAITGQVVAFIPDDPDQQPEKSATSNGEGVFASKDGTIYDAEVGQKAVVVYTPK